MFMTRWLYGISLWMTTGIFAQFLTDNSTVIGESLFGQNLLGSHFGNIGVSSSFDYVIVGGGTAGLVLARRLAEDTSHTVAVIEAGGFYEMDNSNNSEIPAFALSGMSPLVDWNQTTTPQAQLHGKVVPYLQGKTFGGGSARNILLFQRGSRGAFQRWADFVKDASFSFDSLMPYFKRSFHLTLADTSTRLANTSFAYNTSVFSPEGGPLQISFPRFSNAFSSWFSSALQQFGFTRLEGFADGNLLGWAYFGWALDPQTQTRSSAETSFLRETIAKRSNVVFYKSTLAKKVTFDDSKRATGVLVDTAGLQYVLTANKEVILSAGALRSPQLLMVSGIGPSETLGRLNIPVVADLSGVGLNLQDHIFAGPSYRVNVPTHSLLADPKALSQAIEDFNSRRVGLLTNGGADLLGFEKLPPGTISDSTRQELDRVHGLDWPDVEYIPQDTYTGTLPDPNAQYVSLLAGLVAPFSRGNVTIASDDTSVNPVLSPNWLSDPRDREVFLAGARRMRALADGGVLKQVIVGDEVFPGKNVTTDEALLSALTTTATTIWHAAGTARMGHADDEEAVLNTRCSVRGVQSLRVVDAAAFPFLLPGHPMGNICQAPTPQDEQVTCSS